MGTFLKVAGVAVLTCAAAAAGALWGVYITTGSIVDRLSDDEVERLIGDEVVGGIVRVARDHARRAVRDDRGELGRISGRI